MSIGRVRLFGSARSADPNAALHLLARCHNLSVVLAVAGFILVLIGILAFMWTSLPDSVAAFTTACVSACVGAILLALNVP